VGALLTLLNKIHSVVDSFIFIVRTRQSKNTQDTHQYMQLKII